MDHKSQCEQDCKTQRLPQTIKDSLYQQAYDDDHAYGLAAVGSRYEDLAELVISAVDACVKAKVASVAAFLAAEAKRYDKESRSRVISPDTQDRLRSEAGLCRTLELAIERGDDEAPR